MQVEVNLSTLGRAMLWNHCNEQHCIMGFACSAAGVTDEQMEYRKSLVFKQEEERDIQGKIVKVLAPAPELPPELAPFFTEVEGWAESTKTQGALKYTLNDLGNRIVAHNDNRISVSDSWRETAAALFAEGDVELTWVTEESVEA